MDFAKIRSAIFFGLLGLITICFLFMIRVFFFPLFWAAVIASLFYPLFIWLKNKTKLPNTSTLITMLLILIIIVIPLTLISGLLIKESISIYGTIDDNRNSIINSAQNIIENIKNNHYLNRLNIDESFWIEKFSDLSKTVSSYIFTSAKNFTQDSLYFLVMFIIMFYALFYFLRDGDIFLKKLMRLSPLGDEKEMMLYKKFTSTARAAIKGTLIIGILQGTLGAIIFAITGVNGAVILGVIMVITAMIPGIGSYVIWLPVALYLIITGAMWQGLVILIFGASVIGTIDNILRPILIGKDTQMHPLLILFSTLGGIFIFGISGFVIGPIITALLVSFWEMYEQHYSKELDDDR